MNGSAVRHYWTPDNGVDNATGAYNAPAVTSGIYESRSFVRLQDISLVYNFNAKLLKTLKLDNCSFFVSGKNLYTWTKWSGWDPEIGTNNADLTSATEARPDNTPMMRSVTAGFRITF